MEGDGTGTLQHVTVLMGDSTLGTAGAVHSPFGDNGNDFIPEQVFQFQCLCVLLLSQQNPFASFPRWLFFPLDYEKEEL